MIIRSLPYAVAPAPCGFGMVGKLVYPAVCGHRTARGDACARVRAIPRGHCDASVVEMLALELTEQFDDGTVDAMYRLKFLPKHRIDGEPFTHPVPPPRRIIPRHGTAPASRTWPGLRANEKGAVKVSPTSRPVTAQRR